MKVRERGGGEMFPPVLHSEYTGDEHRGAQWDQILPRDADKI